MKNPSSSFRRCLQGGENPARFAFAGLSWKLDSTPPSIAKRTRTLVVRVLLALAALKIIDKQLLVWIEMDVTGRVLRFL
jgi:hypothetical protein